MTQSERDEARTNRFIKSLTELAQRLPRQFDELSRLTPSARQQAGWIALDIAKTLCWHSADVHPDLHAPADHLRRVAMGLLGEKRAGISLPAPECPVMQRVQQLEAIVKAQEEM